MRWNLAAALIAVSSAATTGSAAERWGPYRGANTRPTISADDVRDFAALGGNLLRVTMNSRPLTDKTAPYAFNEENFALLDHLLDACEKYGVRAVIDPHTTPGTERTTTTSPKDSFWSDFAWHERLVELWAKIAARYAGRGTVVAGYDLLNEPALPNGGAKDTPADWNLLTRKLVKAIRAADRTHTIIIEPPTLRLPDGTSRNRLLGLEYLESPPDANVVYSPHMYEPHEFTHQGVQGRPEPAPYPGRARIEAALEPVVKFQQRTGAAIFMGEFSAPRWTGEAGNQYLRDVIEICEQHGWSWAYHAWREWEGWDAERSNTDKSDTARKAGTPRLELLKSFYARNQESQRRQ
jgi:aryl-phospho-beta-D-glucosidase BglC (GH1 family)